jgi:acetyl esterase/lipase
MGLLLILSSLNFPQIKVIKVWSEKIPGAIENSAIQGNNILSKNIFERFMIVTDPTLSIYFPTNKKTNNTAIIICPGGGYKRLVISHQGNDVVSWLNQNGIVGVVLNYRLPNDTIMENKMIGPLEDIQEAIRIVRRNAEQWNINPDKIRVMGFSAGGHLVSIAATHFNEKFYETDSESARPDFTCLIYPVISMNLKITYKGSRRNLLGDNPEQKFIDAFSNELQVTQDTPPAFIVHAADDSSVPVENSIQYFLALKSKNVIAELHIYLAEVHGFGLAKNRGTESWWTVVCLNWLKENQFYESGEL